MEAAHTCEVERRRQHAVLTLAHLPSTVEDIRYIDGTSPVICRRGIAAIGYTGPAAVPCLVQRFGGS